MRDLQCMSFLSKDSTEILVAGCQNAMCKIDVERGNVIQEVKVRNITCWFKIDTRLLRFLQNMST